MSNKKATVKKAVNTPLGKPESGSLAFGKENYVLMAIGLAIIILGFFLMAGDQDIFSTTKLTIAPILVLSGFAFEIFAIMRKPQD